MYIYNIYVYIYTERWECGRMFIYIAIGYSPNQVWDKCEWTVYADADSKEICFRFRTGLRKQ